MKGVIVTWFVALRLVLIVGALGFLGYWVGSGVSYVSEHGLARAVDRIWCGSRGCDDRTRD